MTECYGIVFLLLFFEVFTLSASKEDCNDFGSDDSGCWYTYWYVWLALGLFIIVIIIIIIVYYKNSTRRRTRVRRISVARPRSPPPYTAPSQHPPEYEDAMKNSIVVPPGFHGDIRQLRAMHSRMVNENTTERNYINRHMLANNQRTNTEISIISLPPNYADVCEPQIHVPGQGSRHRPPPHPRGTQPPPGPPTSQASNPTRPARQTGNQLEPSSNNNNGAASNRSPRPTRQNNTRAPPAQART